MEKPAEDGLVFDFRTQYVQTLGLLLNHRKYGAGGEHRMCVSAAAMDDVMMTGAIGLVVVIVGIPVAVGTLARMRIGPS